MSRASQRRLSSTRTPCRRVARACPRLQTAPACRVSATSAASPMTSPSSSPGLPRPSRRHSDVIHARAATTDAFLPSGAALRPETLFLPDAFFEACLRLIDQSVQVAATPGRSTLQTHPLTLTHTHTHTHLL